MLSGQMGLDLRSTKTTHGGGDQRGTSCRLGVETIPPTPLSEMQRPESAIWRRSGALLLSRPFPLARPGDRDYTDIDLTFSGPYARHAVRRGDTGLDQMEPHQVRLQTMGSFVPRKGSSTPLCQPGLGYLGYPGKVGILPEVTVIDLKRGKTMFAALENCFGAHISHFSS